MLALCSHGSSVPDASFTHLYITEQILLDNGNAAEKLCVLVLPVLMKFIEALPGFRYTRSVILTLSFLATKDLVFGFCSSAMEGNGFFQCCFRFWVVLPNAESGNDGGWIQISRSELEKLYPSIYGNTYVPYYQGLAPLESSYSLLVQILRTPGR